MCWQRADAGEFGFGDLVAVKRRLKDFLTADFPGVHRGEDQCADGKREPAAARDLVGVGREERQVDEEERRGMPR